MGMNKLTQSLAAWIATIAILMATLAPAISHAVALAKHSPLSEMEICSVNGTKLIQVGEHDTSSDSHAPQHVMQFEHCPYCLTHAGSFGLPPTAIAFAVPLAGTSTMMPPLFYQAPRTLFIWAPAQSRAPPLAA